MMSRRLQTLPTRLTLLAVAAFHFGCGGEEHGPTSLGGRNVKAWIADLDHSRASVRRQAVLKLANVGDTDPAVAEGLVRALSDRDPVVRRDAIAAVTRWKEWPPSVREQLENMERSDKDARTRDLAKQAIARRASVE